MSSWMVVGSPDNFGLTRDLSRAALAAAGWR
jgi:hypothetical protein